MIKVMNLKGWYNGKSFPIHVAYDGVLRKSTESLDKKGAEIFEGDVMQFNLTNEFGSTSTELGEVFWKKDEARFMLRKVGKPRWLSPFTNAGEIIGDIYLNPEYAPKTNESLAPSGPQAEGQGGHNQMAGQQRG